MNRRIRHPWRATIERSVSIRDETSEIYMHSRAWTELCLHGIVQRVVRMSLGRVASVTRVVLMSARVKGLAG